MVCIKKQMVTNAVQGCEEKETTGGGSVNWYNHYGSQCGDISKELKIQLPTIQLYHS